MVKVSVIISTYNGKNKICGTLKALESQVFKDFETIVVIDGSTDCTFEYISGQKFELNLRLHEQVNSGRANVRNKGAALAKGNLLIFYDDDMVPESDSVHRHVGFHGKYKNAVCGGNQLEKFDLAVTDFDKYRCEIRQKWIEKYCAPLSQIKKDNLFLTAANMSVTTRVFFQLGGFDKSLQDAEDFIFAHKALDNEIRLFFDKKNIAWHTDFCSIRDYINRRRSYTKNFIRLSNIYPELFTEKINATRPGLLKRIVYRSFGNELTIRLVNNKWLHLFPKNVRYKFYDIAITSLGTVYTNIPI